MGPLRAPMLDSIRAESKCSSARVPMAGCVICGYNHNAAASRYCSRCGTKLTAEALEPAAGAAVRPVISGENDSRTLSFTGTGAITIEPPLLEPASPSFGLLKRGTVLAGHYVVRRALKSGGMGAVYLATDSQHVDRRCAIKEMLDRFPTAEQRAESLAWFRREATMLASLQHKYIPQIYDYFIENGRYYVAMEFVDGENLEDVLTRQGCPGLPEKTVLALAAQLSDVLLYLHGRTPPVVFRDLKPANVMLTADSEVRLVDFGIATHFSALRGHSLVGTPGYAPIEQYEGITDASSDLYSLGATVHHLLTGCDPRDQSPFSFKPLRALVPSITQATERLIEGVLRKEAAQRGPNLEEFGRQVRRIQAALEQHVVPAVVDTTSLRVSGVAVPPTEMAVPVQSLNLGRKPVGSKQTVSLPIGNDGKAELRVVLRANVPWLKTPNGQLRVPAGSMVKVPVLLDTVRMPTGRYKAQIELDGNGGIRSIPVRVVVAHWWLTGSAWVLLLFCATIVVVVAFATHLVALHG